MIIEQLKKDKLTAMKARERDRLTFITTLYSEIMMVGKSNGNRETTETEAINVIQKFVKGAEETIAIGEKVGRDISKSKMELEILAQYMPKQMTDAEIKAAVDKIIAVLPEKTLKAMGIVMAQLKIRYSGQYDGKAASVIVKAALQ